MCVCVCSTCSRGSNVDGASLAELRQEADVKPRLRALKRFRVQALALTSIKGAYVGPKPTNVAYSGWGRAREACSTT